MNNHHSAALFASIKAVVLPLACFVSGCTSLISEPPAMELMSRDSNVVSHANVIKVFPVTARIVVDIDRRIYQGTTEPTAANATFGFALKYGPNRYAAASNAGPGENNYYKAILSSADNHVLRCDLIHNGSQQRDGLCVDDFGHVYDLVSTR